MRDFQLQAQLIDEFARLKRVKAAAVKENATETIQLIEEEMKYIQIKLKPIILPD